MEGNLPFLPCFTLYLRVISKYKPPGGLIFGGGFNGGFFALRVWGAYTWMGLFSEFYGILSAKKYAFIFRNVCFCIFCSIAVTGQG